VLDSASMLSNCLADCFAPRYNQTFFIFEWIASSLRPFVTRMRVQKRYLDVMMNWSDTITSSFDFVEHLLTFDMQDWLVTRIQHILPCTCATHTIGGLNIYRYDVTFQLSLYDSKMLSSSTCLAKSSPSCFGRRHKRKFRGKEVLGNVDMLFSKDFITLDSSWKVGVSVGLGHALMKHLRDIDGSNGTFLGRQYSIANLTGAPTESIPI
jgi:hypothetical protein